MPHQEDVSWNSSKPDVAQVTEDGIITGCAVGNTTVSGALTYYKASSTVKVMGDVFKAGNANYTVTGKDTVSYKAPVNKNIKKATIPATVKYNGKTYKVTTVEANAFKAHKKLGNVTIGKNVTKIGKKAFYNCRSLKTVTISGKNLEGVGKYAFKNIHRKAVIKTPKSVTKEYRKMIKASGIAKTVKIK